MPRAWALTGTPGTGKSTVAKILARSSTRYQLVEVGDLALDRGSGKWRRGPRRGTVIVDMTDLRRSLRADPVRPPRGSTYIHVGHLSHLLPVAGIVVLRCHPEELDRRLKRRREPLADRKANVESELIDLVLSEAAEMKVPLYEIDTTDRTPEQVARAVRSAIAGRGIPGAGRVDWLRSAPPQTEKRHRRPRRG